MKRLPKHSALRGYEVATAPRELRSVNGWESWLPTPSLSGVTVTPDTAISLTAVYASVNVIASNVASLPFTVFERLDPAGRRPALENPINDLIAVEPNEEVSAFGFWSAMLFQACLRGNGYAEIERDDWSGDPVALHLVDASKCEARRDGQGRIYYEVVSERVGTERVQKILAENMLHVANIGENGIVGLSPISVAREAVSSLVAAEKMGAAAIGNSHNFAGSIESDSEMDEQARKNIREGISKVHQGPYNAAKILFLEDGIKFNPMKISLQEYQWLEYRKWGPQEIARLFGVPPHKIGDLSQATYSNIEEQNIEFAMGTLRLWCERIAAETNRKLFTREDRRRYYAQHDMNAVVRGNSESLSKWLRSIFGMGGYTVNDICNQVGVNPIGPSGDVRYLDAQLVKLGTPPAPDVNPVSLPKDPNPDPAIEAPSAVPPTRERNSAELLAAVRKSIASDLSRWATKETNAVRRAAKRDDFAAWLDDFHAEQKTWLADAIGPGINVLAIATGEPFTAHELADRLIQNSHQVLQDLQPELFTSDPTPILESFLAHA